MNSFTYERPTTLDEALTSLARQNGSTAPIAGGTELLNWMKEGIVQPDRLIDINRIAGIDQVSRRSTELSIGALARMTDVAAHRDVRTLFPVVTEALVKSASQQLRNMASLGGNLMQRTRCPYFRADHPLPCNKRTPGSGCSSIPGTDRHGAIFGASDACVATHPSDVAVALAALDAVIHVARTDGRRAIPFEEFYRLPADSPAQETTLRPGELIVAITLPLQPPWTSSHYLKVRERASYEFALVSAAVAVALRGDTITEARIALGGIAPKPWRLRAAEAALREQPFTIGTIRAALPASFADAKPLKENGFKIDLAQRAVVRAMAEIGARS